MKRRGFIRMISAVLSVSAVISGNLLLAQPAGDQVPKENLKAVRFCVDITPPIGEQSAYDIVEKSGKPIYVRGIILDDGATRAAWISCELMFIRGESSPQWRSAFGKVIGCPPDNVLLHTGHQHDSPIIFPELLDSPGKIWVNRTASKEYCQRTLDAVCAAIKKAVQGNWTPIAKVYTAEQRVSQLGSTRYACDKDGNFVGVRWSVCRRDEKTRACPVGVIDPIFRTICFEDSAGKKYVALHFYATHPMTTRGRKTADPDVPGFAIEYAQKQTPDVMHIYFNGCGGNVVFGKYNQAGDEATNAVLGSRMGQAMLANLGLLQERPIGPIQFVHSTLDVPFDLERLKAANSNRRNHTLRTLDLWKKATITRFSLGPEIHALSLGMSEVCIEYQLYAQSLVPDHFLACAAYVNGVYGYTPLAKMFETKSYEANASECPVTPEIEPRLKAAIREALSDLRN